MASVDGGASGLVFVGKIGYGVNLGDQRGLVELGEVTAHRGAEQL